MAWKHLTESEDSKKLKLRPVEKNYINNLQKSNFNDTIGKDRWERLAQKFSKDNIPFNKPKKTYDTSLAASILGKMKSDTERYISSVFKAMFEESIDISNKEAFLKYLKTEGFDLSMSKDDFDQTEDTKYNHNYPIAKFAVLPILESDGISQMGLLDQRSLTGFINGVTD